MKKKNTLIITALLAALGAFSFQVMIYAEQTEADLSDETVSITRFVPTAQAELWENTTEMTFPGTIQAHSRVELAFNVPGQIVKSNIMEGATFAKGDILVQLDQRDYQHNYDAALANSRRLEKEYSRVENLMAKDVLSQAEYDVAESNHDVAQAELRIRKKALEDTVLRAPFNGIVAKRYAQNYEHIKDNDPILAFKDISLIEVVIQVPERIVALYNSTVAQQIWVKFDADKAHPYSGTLIEYSLQPDPISRTYEVVIGVMPPTNIRVFPGMSATVIANVSKTIESETLGDTVKGLVVPVESVFLRDGNTYCWVIPVDGGFPEKRKVLMGNVGNEGLVILGGLSEAEHVAVAGLKSLHEGLQVRPAKVNWEGLDG